MGINGQMDSLEEHSKLENQEMFLEGIGLENGNEMSVISKIKNK